MAQGLALHHTQRLLPPANHHNQLTEQKPLLEASCPFSFYHVKTMEDFTKTHAQFIKLGLDCIPRHAGELLSACALSNWGSLDYAMAIFLELEEPGAFDFNTMIRAHVMHVQPLSALQLFTEMIEEDVNPDNYTFPFVLKACALLSDIQGGMQLHGHAIKLGFDSDVFIQNSLINLYGKCMNLDLSLKVFELMGSNRTVASWSSLLAAHKRIGLWSDCLHLFAMMSRKKVRPDESSFVIALASCSKLGLLDLGQSIHCSLLRNYTMLGIIDQTSLVDMYMKCGHPEKGMLIFDRMHQKNVWTYSVVISGLAMHGDAKKALQVFSDMVKQGLKPDEVIFVGVISACSHSGMVDEGLNCFDQMRYEHLILPTVQHYGCMADLMGRAGRLKETFDLIQNMPMAPTAAVWRSLLSASKMHGEIELAEGAYRNLLKMNALNAGDCVILSNMYSALQRWEDAAKVRAEISNRGLWQVPGFSQVHMRGKTHTFVSHDKLHPQSAEVHEMLYQIEWQLRFEGYRLENSQLMHQTNHGEKKQALAVHSQIIAIAFALLNTSSSSPIKIFTNLRMCSECHTCTSLISKIFERDITVRDRSRFHHFGQGSCSCKNCW